MKTKREALESRITQLDSEIVEEELSKHKLLRELRRERLNEHRRYIG